VPRRQDPDRRPPAAHHRHPRTLTVARAVIEINERFRSPGEPRFAVKNYPKDKGWRRVKLSPEIGDALADHTASNQLAADDLLFTLPPTRTENLTVDAADTGDAARPRDPSCPSR
jgi:hypothetical protein